MAVVNSKSAVITALDTPGGVLPNSRLSNALVHAAKGQLAAVSGDSIGSVYRLCRVPSNAMIHQVLLSCTAITTCAGDVGIYRTAADGGAVVDADVFASAASLATALVNSDVTRESGIITTDEIEQPLWQQLGLTADPGVWYDVAITLTAAAGSAGNVGAIVTFAQ